MPFRGFFWRSTERGYPLSPISEMGPTGDTAGGARRFMVNAAVADGNNGGTAPRRSALERKRRKLHTDDDHAGAPYSIALFRARGEGPDRCTAEQRDKLPPSHSITSSAVASSEGGMVRPIAFAVLRLITNSNFVGCSTGRSPGFAPLKILSTYSARRCCMANRLGP
jgi:hypothetical protein